jgi:hypothetical protein
MLLERSLIVVVSIASCMSVNDFAEKPAVSGITPTKVIHSLKGWELYAWRESEEWQFSLLQGTNRNKTDNEIVDRKSRLVNIDAVKAKLSKLAAGEWVVLMPRNPDDKFLPKQIQEELRGFCEVHKLHCY